MPSEYRVTLIIADVQAWSRHPAPLGWYRLDYMTYKNKNEHLQYQTFFLISALSIPRCIIDVQTWSEHHTTQFWACDKTHIKKTEEMHGKAHIKSDLKTIICQVFFLILPLLR